MAGVEAERRRWPGQPGADAVYSLYEPPWYNMDPNWATIHQQDHYDFVNIKSYQQQSRRSLTYDPLAHGFQPQRTHLPSGDHLYRFGLQTDWHSQAAYYQPHRYVSPSTSAMSLTTSSSTLTDLTMSPHSMRGNTADQSPLERSPVNLPPSYQYHEHSLHLPDHISAPQYEPPPQPVVLEKDSYNPRELHYTNEPDNGSDDDAGFEEEAPIEEDVLAQARIQTSDESSTDAVETFAPSEEVAQGHHLLEERLGADDDSSDEEEEQESDHDEDNDGDEYRPQARLASALMPRRRSKRTVHHLLPPPATAVMGAGARITKSKVNVKSKTKRRAPRAAAAGAPSSSHAHTSASASKLRPSSTKKNSKRRSRTKSSSNQKPLYLCPFNPLGCIYTFSAKNEWKRHANTKHLQLGVYLCDLGACNVDHESGLTQARGPNEFNRKDLFVQHVRRMHLQEVDAEVDVEDREWNGLNDAEKKEVDKWVEERLEGCWSVKRQAPIDLGCSVVGCDEEFQATEEDVKSGKESPWEDRMEHLAWHYQNNGTGEVVDEELDDGLRDWCQENELITLGTDGRWYLNGSEPTIPSQRRAGRRVSRRANKRSGGPKGKTPAVDDDVEDDDDGDEDSDEDE